jgi:hypothetical protein
LTSYERDLTFPRPTKYSGIFVASSVMMPPS